MKSHTKTSNMAAESNTFKDLSNNIIIDDLDKANFNEPLCSDAVKN